MPAGRSIFRWTAAFASSTAEIAASPRRASTAALSSLPPLRALSSSRETIAKSTTVSIPRSASPAYIDVGASTAESAVMALSRRRSSAVAAATTSGTFLTPPRARRSLSVRTLWVSSTCLIFRESGCSRLSLTVSMDTVGGGRSTSRTISGDVSTIFDDTPRSTCSSASAYTAREKPSEPRWWSPESGVSVLDDDLAAPVRRAVSHGRGPVVAVVPAGLDNHADGRLASVQPNRALNGWHRSCPSFKAC